MDNTVRRVLPFIRSGRESDRLRTVPAVLALAFLASVSSGCEPATSSGTATPDTAIRSDSAGVMLVEYPSLPPIGESRIRIAEEPDVVLGEGGDFEGPDYDFFRIAGVSQLQDGRLVVANAGSHELRLFGSNGQFLRSAGREGDGPGEFRGVQGPWIIEGDTIVVWDRRAMRLQHFGPEGESVRSTTVAVRSAQVAGTNELQAVLEGGRLLVFIPSTLNPTWDVPERQPLLVALHRIDEGESDSVRVIPGPTRLLSPVGDQGWYTRRDYAFGGYPVAAGAGATLGVADNAHFRVELMDSDGRLVRVLSASVPEVPVTADVLEAEVERPVAHPPPGAELADYREWVEESVRTNYAPVLPAIRDLFVDADERIWVERYDVTARGPSRWEVFGPDGTWIGRVEMPPGFARGNQAVGAPGFSVVSDRLAGVWINPDTGVETVRVYRVIEPDS